MEYSAKDMIEFATWFAQTFGDHTNATEADLNTWYEATRNNYCIER